MRQDAPHFACEVAEIPDKVGLIVESACEHQVLPIVKIFTGISIFHTLKNNAVGVGKVYGLRSSSFRLRSPVSDHL
ncbi:MAG TPA: hypothetical protein VK957_22965 [Lunatimonas sp.]|nr:hypothetical protein [Lunatimonas sp.]